MAYIRISHSHAVRRSSSSPLCAITAPFALPTHHVFVERNHHADDAHSFTQSFMQQTQPVFSGELVINCHALGKYTTYQIQCSRTDSIVCRYGLHGSLTHATYGKPAGIGRSKLPSFDFGDLYVKNKRCVPSRRQQPASKGLSYIFANLPFLGNVYMYMGSGFDSGPRTLGTAHFWYVCKQGSVLSLRRRIRLVTVRIREAGRTAPEVANLGLGTLAGAV